MSRRLHGSALSVISRLDPRLSNEQTLALCVAASALDIVREGLESAREKRSLSTLYGLLQEKFGTHGKALAVVKWMLERTGYNDLDELTRCSDYVPTDSNQLARELRPVDFLLTVIAVVRAIPKEQYERIRAVVADTYLDGRSPDKIESRTSLVQLMFDKGLICEDDCHQLYQLLEDHGLNRLHGKLDEYVARHSTSPQVNSEGITNHGGPSVAESGVNVGGEMVLAEQPVPLARGTCRPEEESVAALPAGVAATADPSPVSGVTDFSTDQNSSTYSSFSFIVAPVKETGGADLSGRVERDGQGSPLLEHATTRNEHSFPIESHVPQLPSCSPLESLAASGQEHVKSDAAKGACPQAQMDSEEQDLSGMSTRTLSRQEDLNPAVSVSQPNPGDPEDEGSTDAEDTSLLNGHSSSQPGRSQPGTSSPVINVSSTSEKTKNLRSCKGRRCRLGSIAILLGFLVLCGGVVGIALTVHLFELKDLPTTNSTSNSSQVEVGWMNLVRVSPKDVAPNSSLNVSSSGVEAVFYKTLCSATVERNLPRQSLRTLNPPEPITSTLNYYGFDIPLYALEGVLNYQCAVTVSNDSPPTNDTCKAEIYLYDNETYYNWSLNGKSFGARGQKCLEAGPPDSPLINNITFELPEPSLYYVAVRIGFGFMVNCSVNGTLFIYNPMELVLRNCALGSGNSWCSFNATNLSNTKNANDDLMCVVAQSNTSDVSTLTSTATVTNTGVEMGGRNLLYICLLVLSVISVFLGLVCIILGVICVMKRSRNHEDSNPM